MYHFHFSSFLFRIKNYLDTWVFQLQINSSILKLLPKFHILLLKLHFFPFPFYFPILNSLSAEMLYLLRPQQNISECLNKTIILKSMCINMPLDSHYEIIFYQKISERKSFALNCSDESWLFVFAWKMLTSWYKCQSISALFGKHWLFRILTLDCTN